MSEYLLNNYWVFDLFFNLRKSKKRLGWLNMKEVNTVAENLGVKPEVVLKMESRLSGKNSALICHPVRMMTTSRMFRLRLTSSVAPKARNPSWKHLTRHHTRTT